MLMQACPFFCFVFGVRIFMYVAMIRFLFTLGDFGGSGEYDVRTQKLRIKYKCVLISMGFCSELCRDGDGTVRVPSLSCSLLLADPETSRSPPPPPINRTPQTHTDTPRKLCASMHFSSVLRGFAQNTKKPDISLRVDVCPAPPSVAAVSERGEFCFIHFRLVGLRPAFVKI